MPEPHINGDLTLREAERILTAQTERYEGHLREHTLLAEAHRERHEGEQRAVDKAERTINTAVDKALQALDTERVTHANAHAREHALVSDAVSKAENALDRQLTSIVNAAEQRDKAWNQRFEDTMRAITNIEKGDVAGASKSLGQSGTIAAIITAIIIAGVIIGIIVNLGRL